MKNKSDEAVVLTFDGQVGFDLYYDDKVIIQIQKKKNAFPTSRSQLFQHTEDQANVGRDNL